MACASEWRFSRPAFSPRAEGLAPGRRNCFCYCTCKEMWRANNAKAPFVAALFLVGPGAPNVASCSYVAMPGSTRS